MSHSVTITRTTTSTTNTSYIVLNTGYLKSFPGILKLFELVSWSSQGDDDLLQYYRTVYLEYSQLVGVAIVTLMAINYGDYSYYRHQDLFHFLMATTFMIGTFCLLLACLTSLSTGGIIAKTIYVSSILK